MRWRHPRLGLGPVFAYELITSARRWQAYALRSSFLLLILLALVLIWMSKSAAANQPVLSQLAELGQGFFVALSGTMLVVVLLAAPAATAGAICLDRARGTLAHMFMTDLSAAEVVLGKLAARLVPVLTLIACTLPVLALLTVMGGVEPNALLGNFVVTLCIAVLGCSLAMFLSNMVGKTHEALLSTYAVLGLWLLAGPISNLLGTIPGWPGPVLPRLANPFYLAFAPYAWPGTVGWNDYLWFLGGTATFSALFTAMTVLRVRSTCSRDRGKSIKAPRSMPREKFWRFLAQNVPWLTPSLDRNPMVWREWHRSRPSRLMIVVMCCYVGTSFLFSVLTIFWYDPVAEAAIINGLQASIGFVILSVVAATSLAEEQARGGFDVLLSTPLSSRQIVLGKWLGVYRIVPLLAILPCLMGVVHSYIRDAHLWSTHCWMVVYILSVGAAITSLGLAMATWVRRSGTAVGLTVALYVIVTVGALGILKMDFGSRGNGLALASPFVWIGLMTWKAMHPDFHFSVLEHTDWAMFWTFVSAGAGIGILLWIMAGFDRHLGRMEDIRSRIASPTRLERVATTIFFSGSTIVFLIAIVSSPGQWWSLALTLVFFTLGKLLLCVRAARSLDCEFLNERRAQLPDSSRLPTFGLVMARWLGAYRIVPPMVVLPVLAALLTRGPAFITQPQLVVTTMFVLFQSAAVASFGVAMAVWFRRPRRALLLTVSFWTSIEILGLVAALMTEAVLNTQSLCVSSLYVVANMPLGIDWSIQFLGDIVISTCSWSVGYGVAALALLGIAIETFDRDPRVEAAIRSAALPGVEGT